MNAHNSSIGFKISYMKNTDVYLFEGDRTHHYNMVKNGGPAKADTIYIAKYGTPMVVVS